MVLVFIGSQINKELRFGDFDPTFTVQRFVVHRLPLHRSPVSHHHLKKNQETGGKPTGPGIGTNNDGF